MFVWKTKILNLKKWIKANNSFASLATAFSVTNEMFKISDDRPDQAKTNIEKENEALEEAIKELELIKKNKLKELRKRRQLNKGGKEWVIKE